jgi:hypothetical protein
MFNLEGCKKPLMKPSQKQAKVMKLKFKSRVTKVTIISLINIVVSCFVLLQGCEEDDNDLAYLELSSSIENLNSNDYDVLSQAKERLAKYVSSEDGKFVLKIKSGSQINISEELFEYFQLSIFNANNKLKDDDYEINGDRVVKKKKIKFPRLKSGVVEDEYGNNYVLYSGIDYTWYGMNINVSHEDVTGFQLGSFGLSYVLSKYNTGIPAVDAWISSAEAVSFFSGLLSSYYDNGRGFSIVCPLYVPTYAISY